MNQTFNLNRFANLFIKHTVDNYKTYLMSFFVLVGMMFLSIGFLAYVDKRPIELNAQVPFFAFFLLIAGSMFTSIIFTDLGNKKKAISLLTLPASHFEKFLIAWTWSFLIFQLLFIGAFYLIVIIINGIFASKFPGNEAELMSLISLDVRPRIFLLLFAVLHSIVIWASIFFEKHHFIKIAFSFFISVVALIYLNTKFLTLLISEHVRSALPFIFLEMEEEKNYFQIMLPRKDNIYVIMMLLVFTIIVWVSSFYRLKEKEV